MLHQLELAQPSPARGLVEALPRNRATVSRHGALFRGAARFHEKLLKQGAQVEFGPQLSVRQNGKSAMFVGEAPLLADVRASAAGRGVINTSASASNAAPVLAGC